MKAFLFIPLLMLILLACKKDDATYILDLGNDFLLEENTSVKIGINIPSDETIWSTGNTADSIEIDTAGVYSVTVILNKDTLRDTISVEIGVPIAKIETNHGNMYFQFYNQTPLHKSAFRTLAEEEHYDQFIFNRVIQNFVIQGGCPDEVEYFENSPYLIEPEFVDSIKHIYGAVGMGRDDNPDKLSNACQFYIVNKPSGLNFLNMNYTVFGQLIEGFEVLESISNSATNNADEPLEEVTMKVSVDLYTHHQIQNGLN